MYLFKNRLYISMGTVARNERYPNSDKRISDDNGFDGKIGKLIGRCYCRLIPKLDIRFNMFVKSFEFGWLIWNFYFRRYSIIRNPGF